MEEVALGCMEWKVMVPDGWSVKPVPVRRAWLGLLGIGLVVNHKVCSFMEKAWNIGVNDPRKVIHCLKVGLALTLVSLLYYVRPLYHGIGGSTMAVVMTVVVVFEFTVGGTVYKAFNRVSATLLAVSLAIGIHFLADKSGKDVEPIIRSSSVFLIALVATFSRFIPNVKAQYDYGMMTFIVTFVLVLVSGYRVDKLLELAAQRCSTIAIGSTICTLVCVLVHPVWAGDDLHLLVTRNMEKLANSIDGCIIEYFKEGGNISGKEEWCQRLQGYKCVLNSKTSEESRANLARWEPAHGQFGFRHPWKQYLKAATVSQALLF